MSAINLVLGDQLFSDLSALPDAPILMVEDRGLANHYRYHSHKLVLTFSAMRHFAQRHSARVVYRRIDQNSSVFGALEDEVSKGVDELHVYEPADAFFPRQLADWASDAKVRLTLHDNPMFLTTSDAWRSYAGTYKRRFMAEFYKWQRRRLGLLLDDEGGPLGGKWSFDEENRKPVPHGHFAPGTCFPQQDEITREVIDMVRSEFAGHVGDPRDFRYPVTHDEARLWLETFVEERLDLFGDYEDALSSTQPVLYHSLLTPALNTGLLTPSEVLSRVLERQADRPVPLNSLEGFIRQIIGWREFVRGVYREVPWNTIDLSKGRRLKPCWFEGEAGLPPLDLSLRRAKESGWCHHIERLMVIGSAMYMCSVSPLEAKRLFMEMFVDAAEWVMDPNVFGMSQFNPASFATKPYISGSAYLLRMSDYGKGEWCDVWDGLYWQTVERHFDEFAANPRMTPVVLGLKRLEPGRKKRIFDLANAFVESVTESVPAS